MTETEKVRDERVLSLLTFITNVGDFISLFVFLKLLENISGSIVIASYSVGVRALGVAAAASTFGLISSGKRLKSVIFVTQGLAGALTLILSGAVAYSPEHTSTPIIFLLYLLITILNQWFSIARDSFGDSIGETHEKRGVISLLVSGYFGAQVIGSIIGFFLITIFNISIPLAIDALSFIFAAGISLKLTEDFKSAKYIPFSGIKAVAFDKNILTIFFLRSFAYWTPIAIFNFYRFSYITDHLHLDSVNSVWIDVALGAGGFIAANAIFRNSYGLGKFKDYQLAIFALLGLAVCRLLILGTFNISFAILVVLIAGIFNSINAICTRSIRAKVTENVKSERPKIIALEQIAGQFTVFSVSSLCALYSANGKSDYVIGFLASAIFLIFVAGLHMAKRIRV